MGLLKQQIMSNKIYRVDCDKTYTIKEPKVLNGEIVWVEKEIHQTSEIICENKNVERVWFIGYLKDPENKEKGISMRLEMVFENGNRHSIPPIDSCEHPNILSLSDWEKLYFEKAEEYLNNGGVGIKPEYMGTLE